MDIALLSSANGVAVRSLDPEQGPGLAEMMCSNEPLTKIRTWVDGQTAIFCNLARIPQGRLKPTGFLEGT